MARDYRVKIVITAKDDASGTLMNVGNALKDVAKIAGGVLLANALRGLTRNISQLARGAVSAASDLQVLRIGLESLIAVEAVAAGAFDSVGDALGQLDGNVQALISDLRDLSFALPGIEFRDVVDVFRLNLAYGATIDNAQKLTKAIGEYGLGLGITNQMIQRMGYNLTQALVAGDMTVINLRQLKLASLDLAKVFRKELGLSIEEVRAQLKSGQLTLQELTDTFVDYVDKTWGPAAARMQNTLRGVTSRFKDLFFWVGTDLLTPALEEVTKALNATFDEAKELLDSGLFAAIGNELGNVARVAIEAGSAFREKFGAQLAAAAESAFRWGVNIVSELAAGMVQGAVAVLVAAMRFIGSLLARWLGAASPPRIAPDIDKWGAAAFTEYLKGFRDAEWSILDSVGSMLEAVLSTLVDIGSLAEETLGATMVDMYTRLSRALARYTNTGNIAVGIFQKLREVGGEFGKELARLARLQFSLVDATKAYEKAVEVFDKAQKKEERTLNAVEKLRSEYEELIATRAPMREIRQAKEELDLAEKRHKRAERERKEAEKSRTNAEKRLALLRKRVNWQQKLLRLLQQMARWRKRQEDAEGGAAAKAKKAAKGAGGAGGAGIGGIPELPIPDFSLIEESVGGLATSPFMEKLKDIFAPLRAAWEDDIKPALELLREEWDKFYGILQQVWDEKIKPVVDGLKKLIPPNLVKNLGKVAGAVGTVAIAFWQAKTIIGIVGGIIGALTSPIGLLVAGLTLLYTAWVNDWGGIRTTLTRVWGEIQPKLEGLYDWLETNIPKAMETLSGFWDGTLKPVFEGIRDFLKNDVLPKLEDFWKWLGTEIPNAFATAEEFYNKHFAKILSALWTVLVEDVLPAVEDLVEIAGELLAGAFEVAKAAWDEFLYKALKALWNLLDLHILPSLDDLVELLGTLLVTAMKAVKWAWDHFLKFFFESLVDWAVSAFRVLGWVVERLNDIIKLAAEVRDLVPEVGPYMPGEPFDPRNFPRPPFIPEQQHGGFWRSAGFAKMDPDEAVIPLNNPTGINALARAMQKAGLGSGSGTPLIIEGGLHLHGVNDTQSLLHELQMITIPG